MHILKSDLVLRELEHGQVDGPGTAYLFFYDKQGHWGLGQDAADAVRTHMEEAVSEWILHSAHFTISLLPLMEVWQRSFLEEEGLALTDSITGEDSESKVEVVGGLNVCLAQAMSHYQKEEQQCFVCGSPGHFA